MALSFVLEIFECFILVIILNLVNSYKICTITSFNKSILEKILSEYDGKSKNIN